MKWVKKELKMNTEWHLVFAWFPVETECRHMVWLEFINRRYKVNGDSGKYVYRIFS